MTQNNITDIEKCARLMGIVYSEVIGGALVLHDAQGFGHSLNFNPYTNKADLMDVECALGIDVEWDNAASGPNVKCTKRIGSKFAYSKVWLDHHQDKFTARAHAVMAVVEQIYDAKFGKDGE